MAQIGYKQIFKDKVLNDLKKSGLSVHQIAKKYEVSPKTIYTWLDKQEPRLKDILKENRRLKAENKLMIKLIKKLSVDFKKKS